MTGLRRDDPLAQLAQVAWLSSGQKSPRLEAAGVPHHFGVKDEFPTGALFLRQVHGTRMVNVTGRTAPERGALDEEGDGVFATDRSLIAVRTADCLPLLGAGVVGKNVVVAAAHAGWRGLTAGMVGEMIRSLRGLGAPLHTITVAIGPAIGPGAFEVGHEVIAAAATGDLGLSPSQHLAVCTKGQGDRWHFDLQGAAVFSLLNDGIDPNRIDVLRVCTKASPQLNSYRREGKGVGSNYSWIRCK